MQLRVVVEQDRIRVGHRFALSLQRTLRVPDDGREYGLPVSLGRLPIDSVAAHPKVPAGWRGRNAFFVPMYQREALWLGFDCPNWKPAVLKVGVGGVNAVSGQLWGEGLCADPQDYLVCPPQPWLDGVNAGPAQVRQFVAMPLGSGATVEAHVTGTERVGAIQLQVHEPLPGRFPDVPPADEAPVRLSLPRAGPAMGLAPGGRIRQRIYRDPHGIETWQARACASFTIYMLDSLQYEWITGRPPPPSPIDARTYQERGLPWLALYDADLAALAPAEPFAGMKSVDFPSEDR